MYRIFLSLLIALLVSKPALASIVWDWSPEKVNASLIYTANGPWIYSDGFYSLYDNSINDSYYADSVKFQYDTIISGIDTYINYNYILNENVNTKITIWNDNNNNPGDIIYQSTQKISDIDTNGAIGDLVRLGSGLSRPFTMTANTTYWISIAGAQYPGLGVATIFGIDGGDNSIAGFGPNNTQYPLAKVGDMAFRLHGSSEVTTNPVPIPGPIILLGSSLLGLIGICRRQRA